MNKSGYGSSRRRFQFRFVFVGRTVNWTYLGASNEITERRLCWTKLIVAYLVELAIGALSFSKRLVLTLLVRLLTNLPRVSTSLGSSCFLELSVHDFSFSFKRGDFIFFALSTTSRLERGVKYTPVLSPLHAAPVSRFIVLSAMGVFGGTAGRGVVIAFVLFIGADLGTS